jgi:Zn-dependent M28 family amino/carboxypeptidase
VVEVQDFDELAKLGREQVEGKIVFFNRPMNPSEVNTFAAYGGAANQRAAGPSEAAKYGAVGAVVRSLTLAQDDVPHTGSLRYALNVPQIPAIAISTNDANLLSKLLKDDADLRFYFETHCEMKEDELSYNVIGELRGSEYPEEIIAVGGHLDSWDLGQGAHDDGAGCVQSIEVLRIFKALGLRPKRTLRAVMFMNEENGLRGGVEYAAQAEKNKEKHLAAIESDRGGFTPRGFSIDAEAKALKKIQGFAELFRPYGIYEFVAGGSGADISPLKSQGVPLIGFVPDSQRYFKYHHTAIDTFDKVDQRELEMGAAAMAGLVYLLDRYGL